MGSFYRIGEFAEMIGRSAATVRRWEAEGRIIARRSPSGQRFYDDADVQNALRPGFDHDDRTTVVYCRAPSATQWADLDAAVGDGAGPADGRAHVSCRLYELRRYEKTLTADSLTGGPS